MSVEIKKFFGTKLYCDGQVEYIRGQGPVQLGFLYEDTDGWSCLTLSHQQKYDSLFAEYFDTPAPHKARYALFIDGWSVVRGAEILFASMERSECEAFLEKERGN